MFSGLKDRLQVARNRLGASIGAVAEAARPAQATAATEKAEDPKKADNEAKNPTFADKVRVLIIERELVVSLSSWLYF